MSPLTNKERLQAVLSVRAIDIPPHFELGFQLEEEAFGIHLLTPEGWEKASAVERERDLANQVEIRCRLVEDYGWAAVQGPTRLLKQALGAKALICDYGYDATFWMPTGGDLMDFIVRMFENPEEMHEMARAKCKGAIELAKRQQDEGVDFVVLALDYAYNNGPFISPTHFQEFITPYLAEAVSGIHALGLPVILHSDGDLREILDQIVSTGVDGYQSVDPQGHMDIKEVRAQYPDLVLMGNVQCSLLQDVNQCLIRESARYAFTHGHVGGRYIFSTSNLVFKGMPLESYHIMLDEFRKCCAEMLSSNEL